MMSKGTEEDQSYDATLASLRAVIMHGTPLDGQQVDGQDALVEALDTLGIDTHAKGRRKEGGLFTDQEIAAMLEETFLHPKTNVDDDMLGAAQM